MTLVFCLFGVMLLIPAYPYTVMWFYVMLGLFFSFLNGREQKDVYYSALLPIRKRDTVKANCLFVGLIELLALVIAIPFALLRAKLGIGDNPVGLNANVTLFACGLMLFAVFNAVFLLSFYRTAYKVGVSFVKACIVMAVAAFIMEAAVHFPALSRFNGYDLACQLPLLAAGLAFSGVLPVNKKLWSSTFVCVVGAYSLGMFALFYYLIDVRGWRRWTLFFRVVGLNSITIYLAQRIVGFGRISDFFLGGIASKCPEAVAAVISSAGYVAVCWLFLYFLYRKNVFLKV